MESNSVARSHNTRSPDRASIHFSVCLQQGDAPFSVRIEDGQSREEGPLSPLIPGWMIMQRCVCQMEAGITFLT